jgi:hypothetical protein
VKSTGYKGTVTIPFFKIRCKWRRGCKVR